jgi:hypothetical protein
MSVFIIICKFNGLLRRLEIKNYIVPKKEIFPDILEIDLLYTLVAYLREMILKYHNG